MLVNVKKLDPHAVIPFKKFPEDFCYDVVATSIEELAPNIYRYGIGLAFEIDRNIDLPEQFRGCVLSIDLRPRSSVYETGLILANCEGTIDEFYRGQVKATFYHVLSNMPKYEVGDKIGQIKIGITLPITFKEVDELSITDRNTGGFGHTGRKYEGNK